MPLTAFGRLTLSVLTVGLIATTANAAPETWDIDTGHSTVGFTVRHNIVSKSMGRFADFNGTLMLDPAKLEETKIDVTIDAASIDTDNDKRDGHLKSPDFFDVAKFPTITFKSTSVKPKDKETGVVMGDLTINGITKPVELMYTVLGFTEAWGGQRAGFEATGTINRKDFNVSWSKVLDNGGLAVAEKVDITIALETVKAKPEEAKPAGK
ncbi:MAG: YceI family protein [Candidatus Eisenbacteria bacterium]|mgnify:CR=1 FL=1|nr:YceI family protein [Candidatus Eisenbacteria bacterium]